MIHVYGISHVSEESIELIEEKIEDHEPDLVALELDQNRLEALLSGGNSRQMPFFLKIVKKFQDSIGRQTGVMPGDELLYAYNKSISKGIDVALIDRDIRVTVERLKNMSAKEKLKGVLSMAGGLFFSKPFDVEEIPEEEVIEEILEEFEKEFPQLYEILVRERDHYMTESLKHLREEDPEREIVAFVGAAHRKSIEENLESTE